MRRSANAAASRVSNIRSDLVGLRTHVRRPVCLTTHRPSTTVRKLE
jgi:hypothetical protein